MLLVAHRAAESLDPEVLAMKQQRWQRLRRILVGDDNSLRRHVDKLESAVVVSLVITFGIAAPVLAISAVQAVSAASDRQLHAETNWKQVPAVLTQSAAAGVVGLDGEWDTSWVTAKWTAPDGAHCRGIVAVDLNARAGQSVPVWVTPAGQLSPAKLTGRAVADREAMAATAVCLVLAVALSITGCVVRVLANRRRMAGWTKAWEAIGPRWSSLR
jgi:hypothetical protein